MNLNPGVDVDVRFSIRSYNAAVIPNQQPQTLAQVLENDPTIRTNARFAFAGKLFVIRGFTLAGEDIGCDGSTASARASWLRPSCTKRCRHAARRRWIHR